MDAAPHNEYTPFICDSSKDRQETNTWISINYCSDWNLHEAIREILQNQMDGMCNNSVHSVEKKNILPKKGTNEYDFDFVNRNNSDEKYKKLGEIRYDEKNKTLTVWNYGSLATADLLLGGIKDKSDNKEIIGRFGEGMKLAALAFCRLKKIFIVVTGGQEWRFKIKEDENFKRGNEKQKCLFWWKAENNEEIYNNKIYVIIKKIELNEWKNEIDNYLYLTSKKKFAIDINENKEGKQELLGQILLGEDFRSKIFVKDIFVINTMTKDKKEKNHITDCFYGFNTTLQLDRDRNCIPDLNERNQKTSKIIAYILNNYNFLLNKLDLCDHKFLDNFPKEIFDLLAQNFGVTYYLHVSLDKEGADLIWDKWKNSLNSENEIQPCYIENEKSVKKYILERKLDDNFYPYDTKISWQQWNCLKKSSHYMTIDEKFINLKNNSKEEKNIPEKYSSALQEISNKMKLVFPNFTPELIQFKIYATPIDENFSFTENGKIYLSSELLKSEPDLKWKTKILAKCFQMKNINTEDIIRVFGILK